MRVMRLPVFVYALLLCLTLSASGEVLTYDLRWGMVSAGEVTLKRDKDAPSNTLAYQLNIETDGFVDTLYSVRTHVQAVVDADSHACVRYEKRQREGSYHRDVTILFDRVHKKLLGTNNEHRFEQPLPEGLLLDPLAALYYFRTLPSLEVGAEYIIPITDGEFVEACTVSILALESVKTEAGVFECYKIEPKLGKVNGFFRKRKGASLHIWLSADERRLPVQIKSKAPVGSFRAKLVTAQPDN